MFRKTKFKFWLIGLVVLAVVAWFYLESGNKEKHQAPPLPEDFDPRQADGEKPDAASYYAAAIKWKRYDLLVAAADLPVGDWRKYLSATAELIVQAEALANQCLRAATEKLRSDPVLAMREDVHALLGLARQCGYGAISGSAKNGIYIEQYAIRWLARLLADLPEAALAELDRVLTSHWREYNRLGTYSSRRPDYIDDHDMAGPAWEEAAKMEKDLVTLRRLMQNALIKVRDPGVKVGENIIWHVGEREDGKPSYILTDKASGLLLFVGVERDEGKTT